MTIFLDSIAAFFIICVLIVVAAGVWLKWLGDDFEEGEDY